MGEWDQFSQSGGIIELFVRDDRLAFEINNANAETAGLKLSSQLLKLGQKASLADP